MSDDANTPSSLTAINRSRGSRSTVGKRIRAEAQRMEESTGNVNDPAA